MNYRILPVAILLAIPAMPLGAQTGQVGGPAIGFVFDGSVSALRPVLGIPGASTMGAAVDAGFPLAWAAVAPRQDSAIALDGGGLLHLLRLGAGAAEVPCGPCPSTAEAAVFSPSGSAVALYSAGRVQIVTGLPATPAAGASFEVASPARGTLGRSVAPPLALSDDGAWLLVSTRNSVDLWSAAGGPRELLAAAPFALVAFAPGGHDAAVADARGAALLLIHDVAASAARQPLAVPDDIRQSAALAFSADGSRLFLANPQAQSVTAIDVASGARTSTACNCAPYALTPMGNLVRLNEAGSGPVWLLDGAGAAAPRVVFVPPAD